MKNDITGNKFGSLTPVSYIAKSQWNCVCDCGNTTVATYSHLTSGRRTSCGCAKTKHGLRDDPLYATWIGMKGRCNNPNDKAYSDYGGRGIKVCDRWMNSFEDFRADVGERPSPDHSIDRFPNNDGNYEPGNWRWATSEEQMNNIRRNVKVEYDGAPTTIRALAERFGISYQTIYYRLKRGYTIEQAVCETPRK